MSLQTTARIATLMVAAALLAGTAPVPAVAASPAARNTASRAQLDRAVARLADLRAREQRLAARSAKASSELDRIVARQQRVRARLRARSVAMYRGGDTSFLAVLMQASTYEQFTSRWDLITRMNLQDAEDLETLAAARRAADRSAASLLELQAEQARAADAVAAEVARARKEFAASQAALAAYERQTAPPEPQRRHYEARAKKSDPTQQLKGAGAWKTGVASHYGRNFTGRGASGEMIGPYSMIVAHKTLPFGTLIEFEYGGKRAVARVADRGPYTSGRDFDLGPGVVRVLDFSGVHQVRYRIIER